MAKIFLFLLLFQFTVTASAQSVSISGKITDAQGQGIPFAGVFIKNTTQGTSANANGEYRLSLAKGKYELIFKALNHKQEVRQVDLQVSQQLNIVLQTEVYELQSVTISGAEDPAYRIIRNAIRERKGHLEEVQSYTCDVYIKGLQKLLEAPKKFFGRDIEKIARNQGLDSNRTGIIYLSESESKLSFVRPDKVHEEMIASKVSGSNRSFSFNRASDMKFNFYENLSEWDEISSRPMVSPIAGNAMFYYDYKLLGIAQENGETIYKVEVIPKRKADPVFRGTIYIAESGWRIYSVNLYLTKDANINFIDTLKIEQQFFPVADKIWMPSSIKFEFVGGLLGFRFGGYFIAIYKNYNVNPVLDKKDFVEVLRITREVNKKDSGYWQQNRPLPLTVEEKLDYEKKEALAAKRESRPYLDSLDKENNKFRARRFLIGSGYTYRNRYKRQSFNFSPLLGSLFYNTVEGFGADYEISYLKRIDTIQNRSFSLSGKMRYGLANERFHPSLSSTIPLGLSRLTFNLGSDMLDLNNQGTISRRGNTINSLLYERNFQKLYEKQFFGLSWSGRISGGLTAGLGAELSNRRWAPNSSDYTIRDLDNRVFTSNNPLSPLIETPLFPENRSFKLNFRLSYEFSKKFITYPSGRVYLPSRYPRLNLNYTTGVKNVFGSDTDYGLISGDISKSGINFGLYGESSFRVSAGKFLNNNALYYVDYKHFAGTQTRMFEPGLNRFLLLDYYQHSTSERYLEGHAEHNFSGFILNKLPLIRKLKLQEIVGVNYLSTPALKNYTELYFGLKYLNFRGLYGFSTNSGGNLKSAFRISYSL